MLGFSPVTPYWSFLPVAAQLYWFYETFRNDTGNSSMWEGEGRFKLHGVFHLQLCFYGYLNGVYIYPSHLSHVCNFGGGGGGHEQSCSAAASAEP